MKRQTIASVFLAGAFFFVDRGVVIDGNDLGGLTYREAERRMRERAYPTLQIGDELFSADEIGCKDNLFDLVRKEEGDYKCERTYYLNGETDVIERISSNYHILPIDATVSFSRNGFTYTDEKEGKKVDKTKLSLSVASVLNSGGGRVEIPYEVEGAELTKKDLKERTKLLSSFSTSFDEGQVGRTKNIYLASYRIDGYTLNPGEEFSFNEVVGKRTKENGFSEATIISDGVFTKGVGGGVCQVSTTLYNAVLLAGLTVTEARAHTLSVSYVLPSFDAMVSSCSDLKFKNEKEYPVYLSMKVSGGTVNARVYGKNDGREYKRVSKVISVIEPPKSKFVESGELRAPKEGMVSESYLDVYERGELVLRKRLRRDTYDPVQGIEQKVSESDCVISEDVV